MARPKTTAKKPKPYTEEEQRLARATFETVRTTLPRAAFAVPWDSPNCAQSTRDEWCLMARTMLALIKAGAK